MISVLFCSRVKDNPDSNLAPIVRLRRRRYKTRRSAARLSFSSSMTTMTMRGRLKVSLRSTHFRFVHLSGPVVKGGTPFTMPGILDCPAQSRTGTSAL